jgi:hypothetical protein
VVGEEFDGPELAGITAKSLRRLLKGSDAVHAVPLLLAARDRCWTERVATHSRRQSTATHSHRQSTVIYSHRQSTVTHRDPLLNLVFFLCDVPFQFTKFSM